MGQNLISLKLDAATLETVDRALGELEIHLGALLSLPPGERRGLTKMGDKSEAFCRQTLHVMQQNRKVVPASVDLDEAAADLSTVDALRPRLVRLQQLTDRMRDTEMALGSDVMSTALEGYALLKVAGKHQGLDTLRESLSARFGKGPRREGGSSPAF